MAPESDMPVAQVNRLYRVISAQLAAIQAISYAVCIKAPINTVVYCFEIPKAMIRLPFLCARSAINVIRNILGYMLPSAEQQKIPSVAEVLTGTANGSVECMCRAVGELQSVGINVLRQNIERVRLEQYQKVIENWSTENCKKIDNFTLNSDDKEVVKSLAATLKHLRSLKTKKAKLNGAFSDTLANMSCRDFVTQNELRLVKNNFRNMSVINSDMKAKRNDCLNVLNGSGKLNHVYHKVLLQDDVFCDGNPPVCDLGNTCGVPNKMKTVISKAKYESFNIKSNMADNSEKIEVILKMTESISNMVYELSERLKDQPRLRKEFNAIKSKLAEEKEMLKIVEEERNNMKEKLDILQTLIEDQEDFLNTRACEREEDYLKLGYEESLPSSRKDTEHPLYSLL